MYKSYNFGFDVVRGINLNPAGMRTATTLFSHSIVGRAATTLRTHPVDILTHVLKHEWKLLNTVDTGSY
jgi:hypothetical protein